MRKTNKHRLDHNVRERARKALKSNPTVSVTTMIGCTIEFLESHLESQFNSNMNWDNYGIKGWHIDHIKPCSSFDLLDQSEFIKCFHYTNLQPLWWADNLRKSNKYDSK